MSQSILQVLGLQGFVVYKQWEENQDVVIKIGRPRKWAICPHCGQGTGRVNDRGKERRWYHSRINGRRVLLQGRLRRFWCPSCQRAFTETYPGIRLRARRTEQAEREVLEELRTGTFGALRKRFGVAYRTATKALQRLVPRQLDLGKLLKNVPEAALGIDEHSFRGNDLVCTVTLLQPCRQLVAILDDDRQATLRAYLQGLPEDVRAKIRWVCTDLKPSYRKVVQQVLPQAKVVVDHFHVIQDANRRLDQARILEQQDWRRSIPRWPLVKNFERLTPKQELQLHSILHAYPVIAAFYRLKEALRDLYAATSPAEANLLMDRIFTNAETSDIPELKQWARTLRAWRSELLAYFQNRISNGFTEGVHTKIKLLKRLSFGFRNLQVYVRKMLLAFLPPLSADPSPHLLT